MTTPETNPTTPAGPVGVELEVRRLTHRRQRLEQVSASLRERLEYWMSTAEEAPAGLQIALRDFEVELDKVTQRLAELNRHDTRDLAVGALQALPSTAVLVFDRDLRFLLAAGGALVAHGWDPDRIVGATLHDVMPHAGVVALEPHYRAALAGESEHFIHHSLDGQRTYDVEITPLRDEGGEPLAGLLVSRDISDQRQAERELAESRELFERAFEDAPSGMALVALDGTFLRVNPALCAMFSTTAAALAGTKLSALTDPEGHAAQRDLERRLLRGEIARFQVEQRCATAGGDERRILHACSRVRDDGGRPLHFIAQLQDVTDRWLAEAQLRFEATHDALTGVANRRGFTTALDEQVDRCHRYDETAGLFVLDVDDFKAINDAYGHEAGDAVLKAVAATLRERTRSSDVVARIGGDEFAVLIPHANGALLWALAHKIGQRIEVTLGQSATPARVSLSVGYAVLEGPVAHGEEALREADRLMYARKASAG